MQRHLLWTAVACALVQGVDAQRHPPTAGLLLERKQDKLEQPFLKNGTWTLSIADAKRRARAESKLIFAYFTRSYSP